jgi:ABC-type uncharacterized transport system involved in gliding motility auxiliary subunit
MKKNQLETLFYSTVGVAAVFLIIVAFNFISSRAKARVDLTAEKAYTLSEGTKAIVSKLDTDVIIRFYYSRSENAMPVALKTYAQQVEDLLDEYEQAAKGKIEVQKYDPTPDSDAEDSANLDGIEGQVLPTGEKIYLGIAVVMLNEKSALPFLAPNRDRLLEYDISRAITRVVTPEKPVVGVMTPLQIFGQPQAMRRFGQQPSDPWTFITELKRDFEVKQLLMTVDKIDDDVKVLVLVHPKEIGDATQYAIDQFIMRGGKLIAFVDPNCYFDEQGRQNPMMGGGPSSSSLDKLFKAWGLEMEAGKVVADMTFASKTRSGNGQVVDAPAVLSITTEGVNKDDIITSQIDTMLVPFAGAIKGTPVEGLKKTALISSSKNSQLVDGFLATMPGDAISRDFKAGEKEQDIAIRLTGKFKTAFPDGKPKAAETEESKEGEKAEDKTAAAGDTLKESKAETSVVIIADADMLHDAVSVRIEEPFPGLRFATPIGGNLNFIQGLAEQMSGDSNLIAVRSRATLNRPFTVVKDMEAAANKKFQEQIKQLEESAQEAQQKINELQQNKSKEQRFIMSPEQEKELENLRETETQTRVKLKEVRKQFRREIDSLETSLKWANILAMPVIVAVGGIVLAVFKRKRTAAK